MEVDENHNQHILTSATSSLTTSNTQDVDDGGKREAEEEVYDFYTIYEPTEIQALIEIVKLESSEMNDRINAIVRIINCFIIFSEENAKFKRKRVIAEVPAVQEICRQYQDDTRGHINELIRLLQFEMENVETNKFVDKPTDAELAALMGIAQNNADSLAQSKALWEIAKYIDAGQVDRGKLDDLLEFFLALVEITSGLIQSSALWGISLVIMRKRYFFVTSLINEQIKPMCLKFMDSDFVLLRGNACHCLTVLIENRLIQPNESVDVIDRLVEESHHWYVLSRYYSIQALAVNLVIHEATPVSIQRILDLVIEESFHPANLCQSCAIRSLQVIVDSLLPLTTEQIDLILKASQRMYTSCDLFWCHDSAAYCLALLVQKRRVHYSQLYPLVSDGLKSKYSCARARSTWAIATTVESYSIEVIPQVIHELGNVIHDRNVTVRSNIIHSLSVIVTIPNIMAESIRQIEELLYVLLSDEDSYMRSKSLETICTLTESRFSAGIQFIDKALSRIFAARIEDSDATFQPIW